ncbi:DUF1778 domain-containing protein [Gallibacterium salpingitidis]|uniref:DUF1778 domain-containing protein n=1 Tax=Gallibacterium salpingitidis TaxID=505341 RepID=A0A1A7P370_9PAST|nr:DUF1778 domain-containing protein [Gallibacterium salpingitidis]OBW96453.1 hypothetical protein QS62_00490 [Gallibacterium salpingitidis]WKS99389.1 DUF1778 domain-containing protein [Gallibacterium salpingitidis]
MRNQSKARLEAKVNPDIYALFKQAAAISGRTLTDFVIDAVYKESIKTIEKHQVVALSVRDQQLLIDSLSTEKPFNESMQEALTAYDHFLKLQGQK